jgi:tripartite ATP-independent transporter DctM subunit
LIGAPLFAVIAASAMFGYSSEDIDLMALIIEIIGLADMPFLSAIPLFTISGYLLSESNAPKRLVKLTNAILGWMPSGLAIVSLIACAFFTAFTGASGVTIIALGAILYPALSQAGYPDKFNLGLITTSGSLGLLFAPSLPLILYGVVAEVSIDDLFKAGILPGFLMITMLVMYSFSANKNLSTSMYRFKPNQMMEAIKESIWEIPLPFIVLGGIYSGFFAISEAAAVTA